MLCIIGFEHSKGVNKEGRSYELDIFHCVEVDRPISPVSTEKRTVSGMGFQVTTVVWDNVRNGRLGFAPSIGDYIRLSYGRNSSYVSDISLIKAEDIPVPHEPIVI